MIVKVPAYQYDDCTVLHWVDGDTLDMQVRSTFDPGFKIKVTVEFEGRFRLLYADAFEKREPGGSFATAFAAEMMPPGSLVHCRTMKDPDNFGRYLADLWLPSNPENTISAELIRVGLATPYRE